MHPYINSEFLLQISPRPNDEKGTHWAIIAQAVFHMAIMWSAVRIIIMGWVKYDDDVKEIMT